MTYADTTAQRSARTGTTGPGSDPGSGHHGAGDDGRRIRPGPFAVLLFVAAGVIALPLWLWWSAGRTSAAFGDSEVLDNNRLGAATLDVEVGRRTAAFRAENLAPGDRASGQLELVNAGTLPLRFQIGAFTDGDPLARWLLFDVWTTTDICRPGAADPSLASGVTLSATPTVLAGIVTGAAIDPAAGPDGQLSLAPGDATIICLGAGLALEAPNDVQGRRLDVELVVEAEHDLGTDQ